MLYPIGVIGAILTLFNAPIPVNQGPTDALSLTDKGHAWLAAHETEISLGLTTLFGARLCQLRDVHWLVQTMLLWGDRFDQEAAIDNITIDSAKVRQMVKQVEMATVITYAGVGQEDFCAQVKADLPVFENSTRQP